MIKECNLYNIEPEFKKYLELNNFSRTSINNYLADIRKFFSWYIFILKKDGLSFDLSHFTGQTIQDYRNSLSRENTPLKSINRLLSSLRTFSRFALQEGWLQINPFTTIKNIKGYQGTSYSFNASFKNRTLFFTLLGLTSLLLLFGMPIYFFVASDKNGTRNNLLINESLSDTTGSFLNQNASTSANLLTIPIIDQQGNLNLTAPYPKIIGNTGTLSIEAPELKFSSLTKAGITFDAKDGVGHFIFEGTKPALPYESAFYFSGENINSGTLMYLQTEKVSDDIQLLELASGLPATRIFSVDAEGNVYMKGNLVLDGNLIVNPERVIFGNLATQTATSSFSPEP